jgi:hypothetical protein
VKTTKSPKCPSDRCDPDGHLRIHNDTPVATGKTIGRMLKMMFSLEFDRNTASLMSVVLQPGYDWAIFLDELAKLERAALGDVVFGKRWAEPIT